MANNFSREEVVAFESLLEGFDDLLVMSRQASVYRTSGRTMERTNDVIWRPQPNIALSYNGAPRTDISALYQDVVQLSVPATLGFNKTVPWTMDAAELRDALQTERFGQAAKQRLASDINIALATVAVMQGSLVVPIAAAAGTYDNVALCDSIMNEQGVPQGDRYLALSSRDYNGMAGNLAVATRSFGNDKSDKAYERNRVGMVAGFETYKLDYASRIGVAAGGATLIDTQVGAANFYVPVATSTAVTGETNNVDNRFDNITVDNTAGIVAGDAFTISGVNAVHHITKQDTGQPKTFRVIAVVSGTVLTITPPIISGQGGSDAELQYQNCVVTPAAAAPFTWLNIDATYMNPFWHKDALEILPASYSIPTDAGVDVIRGTTEQGFELVMLKHFDINTLVTSYRVDTFFGVVNKQPEMTGVLLFNQVP